MNMAGIFTMILAAHLEQIVFLVICWAIAWALIGFRYWRERKSRLSEAMELEAALYRHTRLIMVWEKILEAKRTGEASTLSEEEVQESKKTNSTSA